VRTDAMEALMRYDFPGNVRELKNVTERALIASGGSEIGREQIEACLPQRAAQARKDAPSSLNLNAVKEQLIAQALSQTHGNVTAAAQLLGVHRSWFYRRKAL
jgi:two-component system response regulator PilR (NtrC family)